MNILIDNDETDLFSSKLFANDPIDSADNLSKTACSIQRLHAYAEKLLIDWLDSPPVERRQVQALNLFVDAVQMLNAACINLGVIEVSDAE